MAKLLIWDIETTNLNASIGYIICVGWKWYGQKRTNLISVRGFPLFDVDPTNDSEVVKAFTEVFEKADAHITWYGKKFDLPFINTRRLNMKLGPLPPIPHIDGWYTARYRLRLHSNRLQTMQDFLELPESKLPLSFADLRRVPSGHIPSLKEIEKHCKQDVKVLELVYERIKPHIVAHPNLGLFVAGDEKVCPACGSPNLRREGYKVALCNVYQQYQCKDCGKWSRGKNAVREIKTELRS